jgi:microcystin degradation protein MlrC
MKIVIARFSHETNTFSPLPTPLMAFGAGNSTGPYYDAAALTHGLQSSTPMRAMLEAAQKHGATIVTPVFAEAYPSGPVNAAAYESISQRILQAVAQGCDAIMLDLHGAMVAESTDDGEGTLLERVRAIAPATPLAVALDLHANVSQTMIDNADIIVGFKTYPHVDMVETGAHAARLLFAMLVGKCKPVTRMVHARVLAHTLCMNTSVPSAMQDALAGARAREKDKGILACSVFGGFPLADTPAAGMSVVVVADGDAAQASSTAQWGAKFLWSRRREFVYKQAPLASSLRAGKQAASAPGKGPVVMLDHGDNCMSGGTCDTVDVLRAALDAGLDGLLVGPTCDPASVEACFAAGVGATITLPLGNKTPLPKIGVRKPVPLRITGTVRALSDGEYTVSGPIFKGTRCYMGRCALLETPQATIVITSQTQEPWDTGVFTSLGADPFKARYLLLKSRMYFRPVFEPRAKAVVDCASVGVTSSDNQLFKFKKVQRPLYPL